MSHRRLPRWILTAAVSTTLIATAVPAAAVMRHPAATHLVVRVASATVLRGTLETFTGSVSPRVPGLRVTVQRLVGKKWQTLAQERVSPTGLLTFSVKAQHATGSTTDSPIPVAVSVLRGIFIISASNQDAYVISLG